MKLQYRCKECGQPILTHNGLVEHIQKFHKIQHKEYYDKFMKKDGEGICPVCGKQTNFIDLKNGYNTYCCNVCASKARGISGKIFDMKCELCQYTITGQNRGALASKMGAHLKTHGKTLKEYYDEFLKKPGDGICRYCGKPTGFDNLFRGYNPSCGGNCGARAVRTSEMALEREFRKEQKELKQTREEEYKNYIQELKDRAHAFDWEGERNTWAGGSIAKPSQDKNNLITDNNITYIDGQEFNSQTQTITDNEETSYDAVFWL